MYIITLHYYYTAVQYPTGYVKYKLRKKKKYTYKYIYLYNLFVIVSIHSVWFDKSSVCGEFRVFSDEIDRSFWGNEKDETWFSLELQIT